MNVDIEQMHRLMNGVHADLRGAGDKVHEALMMLRKVDRYSDQRAEAEPWVKKLEEMRSLLEQITPLQYRMSIDFAQKFGCSGACRERAETVNE